LVVCACEEEARFVWDGLDDLVVGETCAPLKRPLAKGRVSNATTGRSIQVQVLTCGIGEVDATMATTALLLEEYGKTGQPPQFVLSVGCTGAHGPEIRPGDVVLGTSIVPLSCKMVRRDGSSEHVGHRFSTSRDPLKELPCDAKLLMSAREAASSAILPPWPFSGVEPTVYEGKVGSSETWTQDPVEIRRLHSELGTLCEEMEAYGIARVCTECWDSHSLPFLAIKDIANNELDPDANSGEETGMGESVILEEIGRRAAIVAVETIRRFAM
jgi:nucleoside phosphorylase